MNISLEKSCNTCAFACIVFPFIAECDEDGAKERNWYCTPQRICDKWQQADSHTIKMNSIDWTKAKEVHVK
jgi:hypothetical protein